MQRDVIDHQLFVRDHVPRLALVVRAVQAGDRAGVQRIAVAGVELHVVHAPVVESVAVTRPVVAAILGVVDPAAGRDPHVVGIVPVESDREHVGVEHHAVVDERPILAAVIAAIALPPGADEEPVVCARIDRDGLDIFLIRDLFPALPCVAGAVNAGQTAGDEEVGIVRIDGDCPNREILQALIAASPRFAAVVRNRDHSPAPQPPARRPQPSVAVDHQAVDHVTREGNAVTRVLPRFGGIVRDVNLSCARAEVEGIGIGGIDDQRPHVGAIQRRPAPLPECRDGQAEHRDEKERLTHSAELIRTLGR